MSFIEAANGKSRSTLKNQFLRLRDPRDPLEANQPKIDTPYSTPHMEAQKRAEKPTFKQEIGTDLERRTQTHSKHLKSGSSERTRAATSRGPRQEVYFYKPLISQTRCPGTNPHLLSEGDVRELVLTKPCRRGRAQAWSRRLMHVSFGLTPLQTLISSQKEMSGN